MARNDRSQTGARSGIARDVEGVKAVPMRGGDPRSRVGLPERGAGRATKVAGAKGQKTSRATTERGAGKGRVQRAANGAKAAPEKASTRPRAAGQRLTEVGAGTVTRPARASDARGTKRANGRTAAAAGRAPSAPGARKANGAGRGRSAVGAAAGRSANGHAKPAMRGTQGTRGKAAPRRGSSKIQRTHA